WRHTGGADPARFLPRQNTEHYTETLLELLRADLRLHWAHGKRRLIDDYRGRFPELFADKAMLEKLAAEEYSQRLEAGETVAPNHYIQRYGVRVEGAHAAEATRVVSAPSIPEDSLNLSDVAEDLAGSIQTLRKKEPELAKRFERAAKRMPQLGDRFFD